MNQIETILTLTMNPCVDMWASVDEVVPEYKLRCDALHSNPGGGGINVSRALKRLGGDSLAIHSSGGAVGEILERLLDAEGIPHRSFSVKGSTRQNSTFWDRSTNRQYQFVSPGPVLSEENWRRALAAVRMIRPSSRLVVASGSLPPGVPEDFYAELARIVRRREGRLILDASGPALRLGIQEGIYLIKPSVRELSELAGRKLDTAEAQENEAMELVRTGRCEAVVVSLGKDGALLASSEGCRRFVPPPVMVKSSVGAGDSMVAGISWALARQLTLTQAVRFGVAAGTAAVMNPGTELCRWDDVEKLFLQVREHFSEELPAVASR